MATKTNEILVPEPDIALLQLDIHRMLKELKELEKRRFNEIEIGLWKVKAKTQLQEYNKLKSRWNSWGEGILQNIQLQKSKNLTLRDQNAVLASEVEQLSSEINKLKKLFVLHGFPLPEIKKSTPTEIRCQTNLTQEKLDELRRDLSLSESSEDDDSEHMLNSEPNPTSPRVGVLSAPDNHGQTTELPSVLVSYTIDGVENQFGVPVLDNLQPIQPLQYICDDCGKVYKGQKQLNQHVKYAHNAPTITCRNISKGCVYKTTKPWELSRHQGTCDVGTDAAAHVCTECRKKFSYMKRLVSHYRTDHPDFPLDTKFKYM